MKKILILMISCFLFSACTDYRANKLYETAKQYESQYEWEDAKKIYARIIEKYPNTKIIAKARENLQNCKDKQLKIDLLGLDVDSLIQSKKYEESKKKLEELLMLEMSSSLKDEYQNKMTDINVGLADFYYAKNGNKNQQKAFSLFKEAAENGNAYAQYSVGFMLQNAQGTKQNLKEAEAWYRKAAEQGEKSARTELEKIEKARAKAQALDIQTSDRKSHKLYKFLGGNIDDALRVSGGNYDEYKAEFLHGEKYMCYYFGGQMVGGYRDGLFYYGGYQSDVLYYCHKPKSKTIMGVGYRYPFSSRNVSNLPKIEYALPKSFLKLKYKSEYGSSVFSENRVYSINNEEWKFYRTEDTNDITRVYGISIFLL